MPTGSALTTHPDQRLGFMSHAYVQQHGPPGAPDEEHFDILDEADGVIGRKPRSLVHAQGLWHRAVHVWVSNTQGCLLLQQRALTKDVCPGQWDLSCAEHLQTQESFEAAAKRGLWEELQINAAALRLTRLRPLHSQTLVDPRHNLQDFERVETWGLSYDGPCRADPAEVAALRFITWVELTQQVQSAPHHFTPWLRHEVAWHAIGLPIPVPPRVDASANPTAR